MSTFTGFSEEDLKRIKSGETASDNDHQKLQKKVILRPNRQKVYQYKSTTLPNKNIDDAIDDLEFNKCRLSIKPANDSVRNENNCTVASNNVEDTNNEKENKGPYNIVENGNMEEKTNNNIENGNKIENTSNNLENRVNTTDVKDYSEEDLASHRGKLEELQMKQKIMEEQNKKRKEMLAKALADRTRQTEEEVLKLDKIKKELQVLDGKFCQDVGVLRKKIDLACLSYADAEKHYLKVEKEFLQAKIQLQKEREKKELLTEHLCALITHNETRKAQKLETLMLELATNKTDLPEQKEHDVSPNIVDGVDQRTGKMVEFNGDR